MSEGRVGAETGTLVPSEVAEAYFGPVGCVDRARRLGGGMVNVTFLVTDDHEGGRGEVILQRLSDMFNECVVADATVIADHLACNGWEVPKTVRTLDGATSIRDNTRTEEAPNGRLWRACGFIPGAEGAPEPTAEMYEAVGGLLGRFHRSLRGLDYEPQYRIPHFHDTRYHLNQLDRLRESPEMPDWAKDMAAKTLKDYQNLSEIPDDVSVDQLIHGDPRTGNMLFRNSEPFTLCDFDTFMKGTIWVDLGDLIRSLAEDAAEKGTTLPMADIRRMIEGYRQESGFHYDSEKFFEWAIIGAKRITLELTARFLNDTVEHYFAPNPERYETRDAFDLERATLQQRIFANLNQPE